MMSAGGLSFLYPPPCGGGSARGAQPGWGLEPLSHARYPHPQPLPTRGRGAPRERADRRMASLKDMRVRIAATKATQKITKAMQMVAASKLRRAQVAAEAARPYAERMGKVLGNIAASVAGLDTAPALLRGTGSDQTHLLLVCTAERGLCGPFNSAIVRLARETRQRADRRRQDGQDLLRRPQGLRAASPQLREADRRASRAARAGHRVRARRGDRREDRPALRGRASSTSARCSSRASGR